MMDCIKRTMIFSACVLSVCGIAVADNYTLQSPDGRISMTISVNETVSYSVNFEGREILCSSPLSMTLADGRVLGQKAKVKSHSQNEIDQTLTPVVPRKRSQIRNHCQELTLCFEGDYDLVFRAYNDGVAYRFVTRLGDELCVKTEQVVYRFAHDYPITAAISQRAMAGDFISPCEAPFTQKSVSAFQAHERAYPPFVVDLGDGARAAITEADLDDYAGLWLAGSPDESYMIQGIFPKAIIEDHLYGYDRKPQWIHRADYIAKTRGNRCFPWRVMMLAKTDTELLESELIYCLGPECAIKDTSWIRPGKVAWDWFNANNIWGVDFEAGINTATYKHYIDFAGRNGIEYVILDEGWSLNGDLLKINPQIDLPELIRYGKSKGVGLILWCTCFAMDRQLDQALGEFEKWGIKGIKVDFMNRDDQKVVQFYHRVAQATAGHHLLLDFHGAYKCTGLRRKYPNLITREGVLGLEHNKWSDDCTPEHDVTIPFVRMLAGPMDYTPGAMSNAQKKNFKDIFDRPMSQGTRCHQLAMYVIYESPLQMLSDSPSAYEQNPQCLDFIAKVPTTWDDTVVLGARLGDYVLMARRKGDQWFMGAMTDWDQRELTVDFSFLPAGDYEATICEDGVNANRIAIDHNHKTAIVNSSTRLKIKLAPGGGWAARLTPKQ